MTKRTGLLVAVAVCGVCSTASALYSVADRGEWPKSWPSELEPLRGQSQTFVGPMLPQRAYAIRFTSREEFESAWPYILKVKSEGAPVILLRGPNFFLGDDADAGVVVHSPPAETNHRETPIAGATEARMRWMYTNYIELVVDGKIVDLNRIPLPADTPIIDERFEDGESASVKPGGE